MRATNWRRTSSRIRPSSGSWIEASVQKGDQVGVALVQVGEAPQDLDQAGPDVAGTPGLAGQVDQGGGVLGDEGGQGGPLVLEVGVEGAVADPGPGHHVLDPGRAVAQLGEGLAGGGEQPGSGRGGGRHGGRI
jgi:hypothetical protein